MSELGAGSGTSYPTALDTDNTTESTSTKARADVPNDLAAAVIAIETELGTDPAGSLSDVKTFLQTEHGTDGTHDLTDFSTTSMFDHKHASSGNTGGLVVMDNYLTGLILSNDTDTDHDINITAGKAMDSTNSIMMNLSSETTKQIDATWDSGDDAGGMNDGESVGNTTWYHVHLIASSDGATVDVGFDTSVTATNLLADAAVVAAGITLYRRIGSVLTDGSANIVQFTQIGDEFMWADSVADYTNVNVGGISTLIALSIPLGVNVVAKGSIHWVDETPSGNNAMLLISPSGDTTISTTSNFTILLKNTGGTRSSNSATFIEMSNTSSQLHIATTGTGTNDCDVIVVTKGWLDRRGRDG